MGFKQWLVSKLMEDPEAFLAKASPEFKLLEHLTQKVEAMDGVMEAQKKAMLRLRDGLIMQQGNFNRLISRAESFYQLSFTGKPIDRQAHAVMLKAYFAYDQFVHFVHEQLSTLEAKVDAAAKWNEDQKSKPFPIYLYVEDIGIERFVKPSESDDAPKMPWSQVCGIFSRIPSTVFARDYIKTLYNNVPPVVLSSPLDKVEVSSTEGVN